MSGLFAGQVITFTLLPFKNAVVTRLVALSCCNVKLEFAWRKGTTCGARMSSQYLTAFKFPRIIQEVYTGHVIFHPPPLLSTTTETIPFFNIRVRIMFSYTSINTMMPRWFRAHLRRWCRWPWVKTCPLYGLHVLIPHSLRRFITVYPLIRLLCVPGVFRDVLLCIIFWKLNEINPKFLTFFQTNANLSSKWSKN